MFALALACSHRPCVPLEADGIALEVTPTSSSQARLEVTLPGPAPVAVACVLAEDPGEIHLLEGEGAAQYSFALGGLLAGQHYRCTAANLETQERARSCLFTLEDPDELVTSTATFDPDREMTGAYTLANVQPDCRSGPDGDQWLILWDPRGRPRWSHQLPGGLNLGVEARFHAPHVTWGGGYAPQGAPAQVDLFEGELYQASFPGSEVAIFHHDGKQLADGRILTVEESWEHGWASFQLRVLDPQTGSVDWHYHSDEAVAQGVLSAGHPVRDPDPWHLNWADVVGDTAVMSLCTGSLVMAVHMPTREVLWRFGPGGDFAGLPLDALPSCQHGLEFDGDTLLVYDNGEALGYSRATEYELDTQRMQATLTWQWTEPGWYELAMGDVDWLAPDRVLVTRAHSACFSVSEGRSQILEVDRPSGEVVHRLVFDAPRAATYRAERLDGCALFANTALCPALAQRLEEIRPALGF